MRGGKKNTNFPTRANTPELSPAACILHSVTVINMTKCNLGREGLVYLAYTSRPWSSIEESQGRNSRKELESESMEEPCWLAP